LFRRKKASVLCSRLPSFISFIATGRLEILLAPDRRYRYRRRRRPEEEEEEEVALW